MSRHHHIDFSRPHDSQRRKKTRRQWLALLVLCLVTALAWLAQTDLSPTAQPARPVVSRGGDAWNGERGDARRIEAGNVLAGPVTHVRDGDTIEIAGRAVRIANLDCAERGTGAGARASARMRELAELGPMRCQLTGRQSYDREVGTCRLASGSDAGELLIAEGLCDRW